MAMLEDFIPYDHWRDFEHFALRIVEIKIRDSIVYDNLCAWRTQDTADQGVDGNILVTTANADIRITLEAKLRKGGKISLKDIASSIINYLVGFSDMHFVVTNVRFTKDAIRVADTINEKRMFSINYLDCDLLSECLSKYPQLENLFPALSQNIREQAAKTSPSRENVLSSCNNSVPIVPHLTTSRKEAQDELHKAINANVPLIAIKGVRGTDKSLLMDLCMRKLCREHVFVRLDMQHIDSVRTFLLVFLKDLLGLDVFEFLDLLCGAECESIWEQLNESDSQKTRIIATLRKLLAYHKRDNDPQTENYLIREYLGELIELNKRHRVLLLENLNMVTLETLQGILSLFPKIAEMNFSIVAELTLYVPKYNQALNNHEWHILIKQVESTRIHGQLTKIIFLEEYTDTEASEVISAITKQPYDSYFVKQLKLRFGRNPAVIREISSTILKKHITTSSELRMLPIPGSVDDLGLALFSALDRAKKRSELVLTALRWCLHAATLLYGYISFSLIGLLEDHFLTSGTTQILNATGLFCITEGGWKLRSEIAYEVLQDTVRYWDKKEVVAFLLKNTSRWNLNDVQKKCAEVDMLIALNDDRFYLAAETAIETCEKNKEERMAAQILKKCATHTYSAISPDRRYQHLYFLYRCQEKENMLGITSVEERESSGNRLLEDCHNLYKEYPDNKNAELLIRCNLLQNTLRQNRFHFAKGEDYINACFPLAAAHNLPKLGALAYVKKAICVKEQHTHDKSFEVFRQGIHAYPKDKYLRSCYLANYAAHQAKTDLSKAIRCASAALNAARKSEDLELSCWIQSDIFMYRLENGDKTTELLEEIETCRRIADQHGFRADISRTYNLEGTFHVINGNFTLAVQCFRNSIQCYDGSITDQQKFLFRTNLLSVLPINEYESDFAFEQQIQWLQQNKDWLFKKLLSRENLSSECNFAALVGLLDIAQRKKKQSIFTNIIKWFPLEVFQDLDYAHRMDLKKLLAKRFMLSNKHMTILF